MNCNLQAWPVVSWLPRGPQVVFGAGIDGTHLAEVWLWHLIAVCLDKQKPEFARL